MASTIKVKVWRERRQTLGVQTHQLTQEFGCADTHPSSEVLADCLRQVSQKFVDLHGRGSVSSDINVKRAV